MRALIWISGFLALAACEPMPGNYAQPYAPAPRPVFNFQPVYLKPTPVFSNPPPAPKQPTWCRPDGYGGVWCS